MRKIRNTYKFFYGKPQVRPMLRVIVLNYIFEKQAMKND